MIPCPLLAARPPPAAEPSPPSLLQSNKVPVVQPSHGVHPLTPLIPYSNDHFSHGSHSPHLPADINQKQGEGTAGTGHGRREGRVLDTAGITASTFGNTPWPQINGKMKHWGTAEW